MKFNKTKVYTLGLLVSVAVGGETKAMDLFQNVYSNMYKEKLTREQTDRLATNHALDREIHQAPKAREVGGVANLIDARVAGDATPLQELAIELRTIDEKAKLDVGGVVPIEAVRDIVRSKANSDTPLGLEIDIPRQDVEDAHVARGIAGRDVDLEHAVIIRALNHGVMLPAVPLLPATADQLNMLHAFGKLATAHAALNQQDYDYIANHEHFKEALRLVVAGATKLTPYHIQQSRRLFVNYGGHIATPAEVNEAVRLHYKQGFTAKPNQLAESDRLKTLAVDPILKPTEAQIREGRRLRKDEGIAAPSSAQVIESLRLQDLDLAAIATPSANQVNEGIRLRNVEHVDASSLQVIESLRLQGLAPAILLPNMDEINEGIRLTTGANLNPTVAQIHLALAGKVRATLNHGEDAEYLLMQGRGFVGITKPQVIESLRLATPVAGGNPNATQLEVREGLRLGNTSTMTEIAESLYHGAAAFAGAPADLAQAREGVRLAVLIGGGHAAAPQIIEGLRLKGLVGNAIVAPDVAQINEGIRLGGGGAAEIAESVRLGNGGGLFVGGANLLQVQESLRIHALPGAHVAAAPEIIEGLRLKGLGVNAIVAPDVAQINEGIRLAGGGAAEIAESVRLGNGGGLFVGGANLLQVQESLRILALPGAHVATAPEIIEGLRIGGNPSVAVITEGLRLGGGTLPQLTEVARLGNGGGLFVGGANLLQADEGLRILALPGAHAAAAPEIIEGLRLQGLVGNAIVAPDVAQINEGIRLGGGGAAEIAESVRLGNGGGLFVGGANLLQVQESLRIHGLVGAPVAAAPQIIEGLRLQGLVGNAILAPDVAQINEGIRLGGGGAAEIAESVRLGNGGGLFVGGANLLQVQESLRIHGLVGAPVAAAPQIIEGLRLQGLVGNAILAPDVAQIDEGIRLAGGGAAEIAESVRLGNGGGLFVGGANLLQVQESLRILALPGAHAAAAPEIIEGLRLQGLVGNAIVAPDVAQINEGIRLGGGGAAEIAESLRLGNGGGLFVGGAILPQVQESLRIHALPGAHAAAAPEIIEGLRLQGLVGNAIVAPDVAQINEGIRLGGGGAAQIAESLRLGNGGGLFVGGASLLQVQESLRIFALPGAHAASAPEIIEGLRLQGVANPIAAPDVAQINEGIRLNALNLVRVGGPIVIDAPIIDEGLHLGNASTLTHIIEGRRLWDEIPVGGVAALNILADMDMVNMSILLGRPAVTATLNAELTEGVRLEADPDVDGMLLTHPNVVEALRLGGALDASEFAEAVRIKALPVLNIDGGALVIDYTAGLTPAQLAQAMLLRVLPEFDPGVAGQPGTFTAEELAAYIQLKAPGGWFGFVGAGAAINNPTAAETKAAALLRKKVNALDANPGILPGPSKHHTRAVVRARTAPMKAAVARTIQNDLLGLGIGALPYGVATVTRQAGYAELKFVKVDTADGALLAPLHGLLFDYNTGAAIPGAFDPAPLTYTIKVADANLPAVGFADGDTLVLTGMIVDPNNLANGTDYVLLQNPTKAN